jgi:hypothetical protein
MATLNPCVKQILCSLSDSALRSVKALINGQILLLETQITIYQAQILQYDILSVPVVAAQQAAQAVVSQVKESAFLIPLNAISQCADLGSFNLNLQQSIDVALSSANDLLFEATRLLSYSDELNSIVDELNRSIDQFNSISTIIDQCLAGG